MKIENSQHEELIHLTLFGDGWAEGQTCSSSSFDEDEESSIWESPQTILIREKA